MPQQADKNRIERSQFPASKVTLPAAEICAALQQGLSGGLHQSDRPFPIELPTRSAQLSLPFLAASSSDFVNPLPDATSAAIPVRAPLPSEPGQCDFSPRRGPKSAGAAET